MSAAELPVQAAAAPPPPPDKPAKLPIDQISVNPHQPRRHFDEAQLAALSQSIRVNGIIQPIVVRQTPDGYQLIAGERRWRAARMAGLSDVPVHIATADDWTQSQWALVENIHRTDLNPIERAEAYRSLMQQGGLTQQTLAEKLGEDRSTIANHLRLLELAPPVAVMLQKGDLSLGHAKVLAAVTDKKEQTWLAEQVIAEHWSVRALEAARDAMFGMTEAPPAKSEKTKPPTSAHLVDLEKTLSRHIGLKVQLRSSGKGKGRIVIRYGSLEQFDDLLNRLGIKLDD